MAHHQLDSAVSIVGVFQDDSSVTLDQRVGPTQRLRCRITCEPEVTSAMAKSANNVLCVLSVLHVPKSAGDHDSCELSRCLAGFQKTVEARGVNEPQDAVVCR
jgi:hypothetical protein